MTAQETDIKREETLANLKKAFPGKSEWQILEMIDAAAANRMEARENLSQELRQEESHK
ncbi:MAG: hypothetical protein ABI811_00220 [Acidobacteriota bacterium]